MVHKKNEKGSGEESERSELSLALSPDRVSESSMDDDKLVAAAVEGDEAAYAKLVNKYHKGLYFHIIKMVKDREQVEDLVQEAFMKAFGNLKSYNTEYAFSTWIYRIATNHTIDYMRRRKLQTYSINEPVKSREGNIEMQMADESATTDKDIIREQRKEIIHHAINELPRKYREVIVMRHMEEKSYQEISEMLDLPLGTIKAHIFRARELLNKALKEKRKHF